MTTWISHQEDISMWLHSRCVATSTAFGLFSSGSHQDNYQALWFERFEDPVSGETMHVYKGGYWEAKEQGNWDMCPDIF